MDLSSVLSAVLSFASGLGFDALVVFFVAVALDILLGVILAVRLGTFSLRRLSSFLSSQLGTKEFLVVAAAAYAAWSTGGDLRKAAFTVVTAGGSALTLSLLADIWAKVAALFAKPAPAPAPTPAPAPPPVGS